MTGLLNRRGALLGGAALTVGGAAYAAWRGMGSLDAYNEAVARMREALRPSPDLAELVRFATLAPSGHNTQPWRFRIGADRIEIHPDLSRRTPVVDPDDHHLFVSLGCAAETLLTAAGAQGRPGEATFVPSGDGCVMIDLGTGPARSSALSDAIPHRQSSRADYDGTQVSAADLQTLAAAARMPGVALVLITDRARIDGIADLVVAGNSAQMADPAFLRELKSWLRFSPRQALRKGDGLFGAASGTPILPAWIGPLMFDLMFRADAENARYRGHIATSAGLAVFVGEKADAEHWVQVGRACQRFGLQATALGLRTAFLNQPVEVAGLRLDLARLIGTPGLRPDLVMRFGRGPTLPYSARRPWRV